ncbi:hypothetical protein ACLQ3C_16830 [Gordonia sp. DT30]|uniref:hypothetical protein n=1 Tax=unclassified Gordonia (in: high G+C Gram-positive bacteria) TaxID=2657482 RepID=UPI003CFB7748
MTARHVAITVGGVLVAVGLLLLGYLLTPHHMDGDWLPDTAGWVATQRHFGHH